MTKTTRSQATADYDVVGQYTQDAINGLSEELLEHFLDLVSPSGAETVLDAMGGDGNLTDRLYNYCYKKDIEFPKTTLLEFSKVQCEFAKARFPEKTEVVWGDILTMSSLETGEPIGDNLYDRIMIKSANHEIPLKDQETLYSNLYKALKPGGILVNLGFLLEDEDQQREVRELARVKDSLANMNLAAQRRYFSTRDGMYGILEKVGFVDVEPGEKFDYRINSRVVADQYFEQSSRLELDLEYQAAHAKAIKLRQAGRILFDSENCLLQLPGEITVARKPQESTLSPKFFESYPYEFMRRIRVHSELLTKTAAQIPHRAKVLDFACGPGLLTERLMDQPIESYMGVDISAEFISMCLSRFSNQEHFRFYVDDIHEFSVEEDDFDAVTLINILNLEGIQPVSLLEKSYEALKSGGRIVVSGPTSAESFMKAEELILKHLEEDGLLEAHRDDYLALKNANQRILSQRSNYWSEEGMVELLRHLGFESIRALDNGLYQGLCYLIVAEK